MRDKVNTRAKRGPTIEMQISVSSCPGKSDVTRGWNQYPLLAISKPARFFFFIKSGLDADPTANTSYDCTSFANFLRHGGFENLEANWWVSTSLLNYFFRQENNSSINIFQIPNPWYMKVWSLFIEGVWLLKGPHVIGSAIIGSM